MGDGTVPGDRLRLQPQSAKPGLGSATADMDGASGDGILDLIVADSGGVDANGDGQVEIFKGKGDGTFVAASTKVVLTTYDAQYVAVGDLNGDGLPDIAVSSHPSVMQVLIQKADHTFQPPVTYYGDTQMRGIVIAGLGNQRWKAGHPGKCAGLRGIFRLCGHLYRKRGWNFRAVRQLSQHEWIGRCGCGSTSINDGILDYAVAQQLRTGVLHGDSLVSFFLGVGDGTFNDSAISQTFSIASVQYPQDIAAADFSGSGLPGIAWQWGSKPTLRSIWVIRLQREFCRTLL